MKKIIIAIALAIISNHAWAKVVTMQVTIGAGVTPILTSGNISCQWVAFQNNGATNAMRLGDANISATRGIKLLAGGAFYQAPSTPRALNLQGWYVQGTQGDVIDIIYEDGQ